MPNTVVSTILVAVVVIQVFLELEKVTAVTYGKVTWFKFCFP